MQQGKPAGLQVCNKSCSFIWGHLGKPHQEQNMTFGNDGGTSRAVWKSFPERGSALCKAPCQNCVERPENSQEVLGWWGEKS